MHPILLSLSFLLLTTPAQAAEVTLMCPSEIKTEQKLVDAPESWEVGEERQGKGFLESVSLFSGHPKEMAELKPDNGDDMDAKHLVWSFGKEGAKNIWLRCNYVHTRLTLARKLSEGFTSCAAEFEEGVSIAGQGVVKRVVCR